MMRKPPAIYENTNDDGGYGEKMAPAASHQPRTTEARPYGRTRKKEKKVSYAVPYSAAALEKKDPRMKQVSEETRAYARLLASVNRKRLIRKEELKSAAADAAQYPVSDLIAVHWSVTKNDFVCQTSGLVTVLTMEKSDAKTLLRADRKATYAAVKGGDPNSPLFLDAVRTLESNRYIDSVRGAVSFSGALAHSGALESIASEDRKEKVVTWTVDGASPERSLEKTETLSSVDFAPLDFYDVSADAMGLRFHIDNDPPAAFDDVQVARLFLQRKVDLGTATVTVAGTKIKRAEAVASPFSTLVLNTTLINTLSTSVAALPSASRSVREHEKYCDQYFQRMTSTQAKHDALFQTLQSGIRYTFERFKRVCKIDKLPCESPFLDEVYVFQDAYGQPRGEGDIGDEGEPIYEGKTSEAWRRLLKRELEDSYLTVPEFQRAVATGDRDFARYEPNIQDVRYAREFGLQRAVVGGTKILAVAQVLLGRYVVSHASKSSRLHDGNDEEKEEEEEEEEGECDDLDDDCKEKFRRVSEDPEDLDVGTSDDVRFARCYAEVLPFPTYFELDSASLAAKKRTGSPPERRAPALKNVGDLENYVGRNLYEKAKRAAADFAFNRFDSDRAEDQKTLRKEMKEIEADLRTGREEYRAVVGNVPKKDELKKRVDELEERRAATFGRYQGAAIRYALTEHPLQYDVSLDSNVSFLSIGDAEEAERPVKNLEPFFRPKYELAKFLTDGMHKSLLSGFGKTVTEAVSSNAILNAEFDAKFEKAFSTVYDRYELKLKTLTISVVEVDEALRGLPNDASMQAVQKKLEAVEKKSVLYQMLADVVVVWFDLFSEWMKNDERRFPEIAFYHNNRRTVEEAAKSTDPPSPPPLFGNAKKGKAGLTREDLKEATVHLAIVGLSSWYAVNYLFLATTENAEEFPPDSQERNLRERLREEWLYPESDRDLGKEDDDRRKKSVYGLLHDSLAHYFNTSMAFLGADPGENVRSSGANAVLRRIKEKSFYQGWRREASSSSIAAAMTEKDVDDWLLALDGLEKTSYADDVVLVGLLSRRAFEDRYRRSPSLLSPRGSGGGGGGGGRLGGPSRAPFLPTNGGLLIKKCKTLKHRKTRKGDKEYLLVGDKLDPQDGGWNEAEESLRGALKNWVPYAIELPPHVVPLRKSPSDLSFGDLRPGYPFYENVKTVEVDVDASDVEHPLTADDRRPILDFRSPHEYTFLVGETPPSTSFGGVGSSLHLDDLNPRYKLLNGMRCTLKARPYPLEGSRFVLNGKKVLKKYHGHLLRLRRDHAEAMLAKASGGGIGESNRKKTADPLDKNIRQRAEYAISVTRDAVLQLSRTNYVDVGAADPFNCFTANFSTAGGGPARATDNLDFKIGEDDRFVGSRGWGGGGYKLEWHRGRAYRGQESFVAGSCCWFSTANLVEGYGDGLAGSGEYTLWLISDGIHDDSKFLAAHGKKERLGEGSRALLPTYDAIVKEYAEAQRKGNNIDLRTRAALLEQTVTSISSEQKKSRTVDWDSAGPSSKGLSTDETLLGAVLGATANAPKNGEEDDDDDDYVDAGEPELIQRPDYATMDLNCAPSFCLMRVCDLTVVKDDARRSRRKLEETSSDVVGVATDETTKGGRPVDLAGARDDGSLFHSLINVDCGLANVLTPVKTSLRSDEKNQEECLLVSECEKYSGVARRYCVPAPWLNAPCINTLRTAQVASRKRDAIEAGSGRFILGKGVVASRYMVGSYKINFESPLGGLRTLSFDPNLPKPFGVPTADAFTSTMQKAQASICYDGFLNKKTRSDSPCARYYKPLRDVFRTILFSAYPVASDPFPMQAAKTNVFGTTREAWAASLESSFLEGFRLLLSRDHLNLALSKARTRASLLQLLRSWGVELAEDSPSPRFDSVFHREVLAKVLSRAETGGERKIGLSLMPSLRSTVVLKVPRRGSIENVPGSKADGSGKRSETLELFNHYDVFSDLQNTAGYVLWWLLAEAYVFRRASEGAIPGVYSGIPYPTAKEILRIPANRDDLDYALYCEMSVRCRDGKTGIRFWYGERSNLHPDRIRSSSPSAFAEGGGLQRYANLETGRLVGWISRILGFHVLFNFLSTLSVTVDEGKGRLRDNFSSPCPVPFDGEARDGRLLADAPFLGVLGYAAGIFVALSDKYRKLDESEDSDLDSRATKKLSGGWKQHSSTVATWGERFPSDYRREGASWTLTYEAAAALRTAGAFEELNFACGQGGWEAGLKYFEAHSGELADLCLDMGALKLAYGGRDNDGPAPSEIGKKSAGLPMKESECESLNRVSKNWFLQNVFEKAAEASNKCAREVYALTKDGRWTRDIVKALSAKEKKSLVEGLAEWESFVRFDSVSKIDVSETRFKTLPKRMGLSFDRLTPLLSLFDLKSILGNADSEGSKKSFRPSLPPVFPLLGELLLGGYPRSDLVLRWGSRSEEPAMVKSAGDGFPARDERDLATVLYDWKVHVGRLDVPERPRIFEFLEHEFGGEGLRDGEASEVRLGLTELIRRLEGCWDGSHVTKYQLAETFSDFLTTRFEREEGDGKKRGRALRFYDPRPIREGRIDADPKLQRFYDWLTARWVPTLLHDAMMDPGSSVKKEHERAMFAAWTEEERKLFETE